MEDIKLYALGGLDENGKSMYVVDYNSQLYIFDAGLRYPEETSLGIDVVLPGITFIESHKDQIKGFFLTHGHDENMGALPFIISQIGHVDVYGTNVTLLMLMQTAKRFKKDISEASLHVIKPNESFVVNGMNIHAFSVSHSVPNSCGFALETNNGLIVYPGDFILDFNAPIAYKTDFTRLSELSHKPTLALLAESYNSSYNGFVSPHHKLLNNLSTISDETKGRMLIAVYGQTISQIQEVIKCAKDNHRRIYLYTQQAKDTISLLKDDVEEFKTIDSLLTSNIFEHNCIILISEQGNKVFKELNNIALKNTTNESLKINQEDAFVLITPAHAGTELSFARILDTLYETDAQVFNLAKEYVSMHAGSEDLKTMISIFKPKYYIPVRGYYNKMILNAKIAVSQGYNHSNVIVYDNGMIMHFVDGQLQNEFNSLDADEILVDGIGIGDVGNVVINDRRKLKQDGVMIVSLSFSMSTRKIVGGPDIQMKGFILNRSESDFTNKVAKVFQDTVYRYIQRPGLVDFNELRNLVKENVSGIVKSEIDKEPMILPVIISV